MKFGLLFGVTPEAGSAKIDLPSFVIDPKDMVPVVVKLNFREVFRLLEPLEDPSL
jgi:hypothetical protein